MKRLPIPCKIFLVALMMASTMVSLADDLPDCAGFPVSLSVTPPQPGCDEIVTLTATQWLNDTCWTAEPPVFHDDPPDYAFRLAAVDLYEPPQSCITMIIEIPFTRQVGPLSAGPYSLAVTYTSTSPRHGEAACSDWIPFDVTCCADLPPETTSLQAAVTVDRGEIWLNWNDVAGADDYVVFGADAPDDPFTQPIRTAPSGFAGVGVPIETAPAFFVVRARNGCGIGPRH
jgi:hypothetical protein